MIDLLHQAKNKTVSSKFYSSNFQQLTITYLLHRSPLQHSTQLQSSYQLREQIGVNAYIT